MRLIERAEGYVKFVQAEDIEGEFALIPRYEVYAGAGGGAVVEKENIADRLALRMDWVNNYLKLNPVNLMFISARGDSMSPSIEEGDLLLIDGAQEKLIDGSIFVLLIDGDLVVKRVSVGYNAVILSSDNKLYPDQKIPKNALAGKFIVGRVVWIGKSLK